MCIYAYIYNDMTKPTCIPGGQLKWVRQILLKMTPLCYQAKRKTEIPGISRYKFEGIFGSN